MIDKETAEKYMRIKQKRQRLFRDEPGTLAARTIDDEYWSILNEIGTRGAKEAEQLLGSGKA